MISKASLKFYRASPKKVRAVARLIKGKDVNHALAILTVLNKGSKNLLIKLLRSAVANAKSKGLQEEQLFISSLVANKGPAYKRFRAAPFGRATMISHPTSHIDLELELKTGQIPMEKLKARKAKKIVKKKG